MNQSKSFLALLQTSFVIFLFHCVGWNRLLADWPQFGGPSRNFHFDETNDSPMTNIPPWQAVLQRGDHAPIIRGQQILTSEIDFAADGTDAHRVSSRDLATGELQWQQTFAERSFVTQDISDKYPVRPIATPCVAGDAIVTVGYGGSVRCIAWNDGACRWSRDLVQEFSAPPVQYGASSSPWSNNDLVVVACGGDQALLVAFQVHDGAVAWTAGKGPVSYASIIEMEMPSQPPIASESRIQCNRHLVYAAGDEVIAVNPNNGNLLWRYPYRNPGLTNAVTPISIGRGRLLIGGQGMQGVAMLQISVDPNGLYQVQEVWSNESLKPFYCNWIYVADQDMVVGFAGKTLFAVDGATGKALWQKRGWTDANLVSSSRGGYIVRGDGLAVRVEMDRQGLTLRGVSQAVRDRVWAPPVLAHGNLFVRGQRGLASIPLASFEKADRLPEGTDVSAMDAMYGASQERIQVLLDNAKVQNSDPFWKDYQSVVNDKSLELSERHYLSLLQVLKDRKLTKDAVRLSQDWSVRNPHSIVAWQQWMQCLELDGQRDLVKQSSSQRYVQVVFCVHVPSEKGDDVPALPVYITGNATELGNWRPDGLQLTRAADGSYRGVAWIPKGDLQFKATRGSWDREEVRADLRALSNRRQRIDDMRTIEFTVNAWKLPKKTSK
jgi:outer membrane protein assembly factor BamB